MAALYANENLPLPAVEALRQLSHNVLTTAESGNAGIIVCTFNLDYAALAQRIPDAIAAEPEMSGRLIRVNRPD